MRIQKVSIKNFRSIRMLDITPSKLTAICGPNSCGKSNVLRALKLAFVPDIDSSRMPGNVCNQVVAPNAACQISLTFDAPTDSLSVAMSLPKKEAFTYSISIKRNGRTTARINRTTLSDELRRRFLESFLVVHVPPIRDISGEGLRPFKDTLANALKKTRGKRSFSKLNDAVKDAVQERGKKLLDGTQSMAREMLRVDELAVESNAIVLEELLGAAALKVRVNGMEFGLDKLGTGHQSSVILRLYRQLGENTGKFVLYLFEEPDNHLHPTSLRAMAQDLVKTSLKKDAQVFVTSHSPYLLNQFEFQNIISLVSAESRVTAVRTQRITRDDREIRIALGKYGLRPAESLLCSRVIVAEGPNDVTAITALIELQTGVSPDRQDILVIPAGGKAAVVDLCALLRDLGVEWRAVFDWDAVLGTSVPLFMDGLTPADVGQLAAAAKTLRGKLYRLPGRATKAGKIVEAMISELARPPVVPRSSFDGSALEQLLKRLALLDAASFASLRSTVVAGRSRVAQKRLAQHGVWIWKGGLEEALLPTVDAEVDAAAVLVANGLMSKFAIPPPDLRERVLKGMHDLAYRPAVMREVVERLWKADRFRGAQVKSAVRCWVP